MLMPALLHMLDSCRLNACLIFADAAVLKAEQLQRHWQSRHWQRKLLMRYQDTQLSAFYQRLLSVLQLQRSKMHLCHCLSTRLARHAPAHQAPCTILKSHIAMLHMQYLTVTNALGVLAVKEHKQQCSPMSPGLQAIHCEGV